MFDYLITGGILHDGTGRPGRRADIGVSGDRVAQVGDLRDAPAGARIEAAGRLVCPGFIDVHSHSDTYLLLEPSAPSKVYQGVTTEIVGNCGASAAPRLGDARLPVDWEDKPYPCTWRTTAEYRRCLERARPAPNVVMLVGHNTLRGGVMGYDNRAPTADEHKRMRTELARALDEGARGLSLGLLYIPGRFADAREPTALARVVAERGGVVTAHLRSESRELPRAVDEFLEIGRRSGAALQVSHLKVAGRANWPLFEGVLETLRAFRADGGDLAADAYPYTAGATELDVVLPDWAGEGGRDACLARLRDPATRARLIEALEREHSAGDWDDIVIGSTRHRDHARFRGRPLTEAAHALGLTPAEAVVTIVEKDELATGAFFHGISQANLARALAEPWVMLGSDASLRAPRGILGRDHPHPRAYGSFARFLRMALDGRTVAVAEAVHKMTGLPARRFGLEGRGTVVRGAPADLVVLDPARVRDTATYADPHRLAEGIEHVFVNGAHTLRDGRLTGERAGRILP